MKKITLRALLFAGMASLLPSMAFANEGVQKLIDDPDIGHFPAATIGTGVILI